MSDEKTTPTAYVHQHSNTNFPVLIDDCICGTVKCLEWFNSCFVESKIDRCANATESWMNRKWITFHVLLVSWRIRSNRTIWKIRQKENKTIRCLKETRVATTNNHTFDLLLNIYHVALQGNSNRTSPYSSIFTLDDEIKQGGFSLKLCAHILVFSRTRHLNFRLPM